MKNLYFFQVNDIYGDVQKSVYNLYKKAKTAAEYASAMLKKTKSEILYYEEIKYFAENTENTEDLYSLLEEMTDEKPQAEDKTEVNIQCFEIEGFKNNPLNRCYLCKKELFTKLGAYDYQDIESFDSEGREAPFSKYKMLGFLDYGLAVFENFEENGNATYIMTFQELKSYIIKEAEKSIVFKKSKQALREEMAKGRAVRVCNHTVNWGENIIKAMKELSKDARKNIDIESERDIINKIQEEYRIAKEKQLEAEKNALEEARAKQNEVIQLEKRTKEEYDKKRGKTYGE